MKRILSLAAASLLVFLSVGTARADFVFTTGDGALGYISAESATSVDVPVKVVLGLGADTFLTAWNKGEEKVAVIQHNGGENGWDKALIYTSKNWDKPTEVTLTGVSGAAGADVSNNGNGLFIASRNNGRIVEFSIDSAYDFAGRSFDCAPKDGGSPRAEDVLINGNTVFGLFSFVSSDKVAGRLVAMDGLLSERTLYSSFEVNASADRMVNTSGGKVAIASSGQTGEIEILSGGIKSIVSGDIVSLCRDNSDGLYFIKRENNDETTNALYHWDSTDIEKVQLDGTKVPLRLAWDSSYGLLAVMTSKDITIMNEDEELVKRFESDGTLTAIAFLPRTGSREKGSSNNGCGVTPSGIALVLLLLPAMGLRKKR